jgi:hypothetical protein
MRGITLFSGYYMTEDRKVQKAFRKLKIDEIHNLYSSHNDVGAIILSRLR